MAERRFSREDAFAGSCTYALSQVHDRKQVYDAILVDEAQDLPESFLRLCFEFLKDPKRLVYAYDELQKLSGESLAPPEKIFGRTEIGRPRVRFDGAGDEGPQRDIMLLMLRSQSMKAHWFQLTQGIESLSQGREIQVGFERIVILCGAHL